MLKEKASLLQKHDKALFEKEFTETIAVNSVNHRDDQTKQQTALSRQPLLEQDGWGAETVPQQRLQTR